MNSVRLLGLTALVGFGISCRFTDSGNAFSPSQWEDIDNLKYRLDAAKHVFLFCVCEDYFEKKPPVEYDLRHFKGTVVRTYKGDWKISERIALVHGIDSTTNTALNIWSGELIFLLINEHAQTEIGVEAGDFQRYDPEVKREVEFIFSQQKRGLLCQQSQRTTNSSESR